MKIYLIIILYHLSAFTIATMNVFITKSSLFKVPYAIFNIRRDFRISFFTCNKHNNTDIAILHANNLYNNEEQDYYESLIDKKNEFDSNIVKKDMIDEEEINYMTDMAIKQANCYSK